MEILVLKKEEMQEVIGMKEAIEADKLALQAYSSGDADIPLRINLDIGQHGGQSLYMPGYLPSENALGVKLVSVYPGNREKGLPSIPSLMVLVDDETGFPNSIMDGNYLTQLRTGAISGAASDLLAREDSRVFTMIGTGGQAPLQIEAVLAVRDIEKVYVFSPNRDKCEAFAQEMQEGLGQAYNVKIEACQDLEAAIRQADIISTATTAQEATFSADWVQPGCHINAVGSYTPEMAEIDGDLIIRADKVYCDTRDALVESGDFTQIVDQGSFQLDQVQGELGQLILGQIPGREQDDEITFFDSTGNAVLDIMVAKRIYDLARERGMGQIISL